MEQLQRHKSSSKRLNGVVQLTAMLLFILSFSSSVYSQVSTLKLSTTDSNSYFNITDNSNNILFKMSADGQLLFNGAFTSGTTAPSLGGGTRLWWYPKKAAFRVGRVGLYNWDSLNVGDNSFASGDNTTASGTNSTAMGVGTKAIGLFSTALGQSTTAQGVNSTAMGESSFAYGAYSTALGQSTTAQGTNSTAMGQSTHATGINSTAMGKNTFATGTNSTAMGYTTYASGGASTAMGNYVSTNNNAGSFIIGDNSTSSNTNSSTPNQMMMRFAGGYILYSSANLSTGIQLAAGNNAWSTISDSTKKYAFLPVNGESVLNKLGKFNLRSWSYKGQDSTKFRHYGPMAQEFFAAFGNDKYGIAGNDTTINQADFEGINLIAIQALKKRTDELQRKTTELSDTKEKVKNLENQLAIAMGKISAQNETITNLITEFKSVKNIVTSLKGSSKNNTVQTVMLNASASSEKK